MFHYDRDVIKLGKQRVGVLAIVGLAVECFLALAYHSRKGFNVLRCFNVKFVTVRKCTVNDVYKSSVEVEVEPDLAERALRIARAIGERLERFGFRLLDAVVPELDGNRTSVGEHDLIGERNALAGKSSLEVKLRTIREDHYVETVRQQVRGEAYHGTSKRFWKTAISKSRHDWAERVVVMAIFAAPSAENYKLVCEALPAAAAPKAENWYPLFGWPMVTPAAPVPERRAVAAVPTRTRPVAVAASTNNAGRKRKIDELFAKARQHTMYDQEMASVSDFVKGIASLAARRAKPTLGEKLPRWKKRFGWPARAFAKTPHFRSHTGGGQEGWGATKQALTDIFIQLE